MNRKLRIALVIIAIACFAGALVYPVSYQVYKHTNESQLDDLRALRKAALADDAPDGIAGEAGNDWAGDGLGAASVTSGEAGTAAATGGEASRDGASGNEDPNGANSLPGTDGASDTLPGASDIVAQGTGANAAGDGVTGAVNANVVETGANGLEIVPGKAPSYYDKPRRSLDEALILPQYREQYARNHDLVGWLLVENMYIDYPVMQTPEDNAYYLHRDFYGHYNFNGQLILDKDCDPYTPSYNQIIYGHNMNNGSMFGTLQKYAGEEFWKRHKLVEFDSLMEQRHYVVFACFRAAEVLEGQPGFRYALDFQDEGEYNEWMRQVRERQLYDTGIDCEFGDEYLTLSTCAYHVKNGRLVVVARRIREGESFENEPPENAD